MVLGEEPEWLRVVIVKKTEIKQEKMHAQTFLIAGTNSIEQVSEFVHEYHQQAHESSFPGGFIRIYEDYSLFSGNDLMICIRVDANDSKNGTILVEIIVGGGSGSPFFRNLWTRNKSRIRHFKEQLEAFCVSKELVLKDK